MRHRHPKNGKRRWGRMQELFASSQFWINFRELCPRENCVCIPLLSPVACQKRYWKLTPHKMMWVASSWSLWLHTCQTGPAMCALFLLDAKARPKYISIMPKGLICGQVYIHSFWHALLTMTFEKYFFVMILCIIIQVLNFRYIGGSFFRYSLVGSSWLSERTVLAQGLPTDGRPDSVSGLSHAGTSVAVSGGRKR